MPSVSALECKQVSRTWRTIILRVWRNKLGLLFVFEGISSTRKNQREVQLYYEDRVRHEVNNLEKYDLGETLVYGPDYREASLQTLVFDNIIVGSCNGLVCFLTQNTLLGDHGFIICNPVTGEYGFVGGPRTFHHHKSNFASAGGFGYIQSTKEYKVVYYDGYSIHGTHAYVYTLGSRVEWRNIKENIPYIFEGSSIFANGAIHWLHAPKDIVALDLVDEKFKSVPSPPLSYNTCKARPRLVLLEEMCLVVVDNAGSQLTLDIWSFKKTTNHTRKRVLSPPDAGQAYYDCTWTWNKDFRIACEYPPEWYNPFAITESNEVLLWLKDYTKPTMHPTKPKLHSQSIYCYDRNTSTLDKFPDTYSNIYGSCLQIIPHMNTLVSLEGIGEFLDNVGNLRLKV